MGLPFGLEVGLLRRGLSVPGQDLSGWISVKQSPGWTRVVEPVSKLIYFINYQGHDLDWASWVGEDLPSREKDSDGLAYSTFSNPSQSTGHASPLLVKAYQTAPKPLEYLPLLCAALKKTDDSLESVLSPEQVDAVLLIYRAIVAKDDILLADETGYGKGRVLASVYTMARSILDYRVLFVTENQTLFSDFYRDLSNVSSPPTNPAIIHSDAVIKDSAGNKVLSQMNCQTPTRGDMTAWTTYSQVNRDGSDRLKDLVKWLSEKPSILILDESQNAAGDSAVGEVPDGDAGIGRGRAS